MTLLNIAAYWLGACTVTFAGYVFLRWLLRPPFRMETCR